MSEQDKMPDEIWLFTGDFQSKEGSALKTVIEYNPCKEHNLPENHFEPFTHIGYIKKSQSVPISALEGLVEKYGEAEAKWAVAMQDRDSVSCHQYYDLKLDIADRIAKQLQKLWV